MIRDVKCDQCGTLYGKESTKDGWTVLAIKYRDMYRMVWQGQVTGPCRGCGDTVVWQSRKVSKG